MLKGSYSISLGFSFLQSEENESMSTSRCVGSPNHRGGGGRRLIPNIKSSRRKTRLNKWYLQTRSHLYPAQPPHGFLTAASPSHASAHVLYLLSWTSILQPNREKGEKTNHSQTYSCCSLSCQHFSQTSPPPSCIDTEK